MASQNRAGWLHLEPPLHAEGHGQNIFRTQSQAQAPRLCLFAPKALIMSQPSLQTRLGWPKGAPTFLLVWFPKIKEICVTTSPCLLVPVKAREPGG